MCGQQPSCYPIGYQLNSRINCPRSSPCLPCRMKSIKENEGQYPEWRVIWKHALLNAFIPVVTFLGFMFGIIIASSITTETVFVWPGLGRLVFEALMARDFPVIQGVVLVWSAIIIFLNLCVDLTYGLLDPRIRLLRS